MRRSVATLAILAVLSTSLIADVTVTSTMTIQGPAAQAMGGQMPTMVMRIKGNKARAEMSMMGQDLVTITDLDAKQIITLQPKEKTAQIYTPASKPSGAPVNIPKLDATVKPTGKSQPIDGVNCDEYSVNMSMNMAEMQGAQIPPEAAEMMKDVRMVFNGSIWAAKSGPGVAEFVAFQRSSSRAALTEVLGKMPGLASGGLDRILAVMSSIDGMPYLMELNMTFEGTGQMVEMMKQMGGAMSVTNKVTNVSTSPIAEEQFAIPADYKVVK
jgi:hypothetical protein